MTLTAIGTFLAPSKNDRATPIAVSASRAMRQGRLYTVKITSLENLKTVLKVVNAWTYQSSENTELKKSEPQRTVIEESGLIINDLFELLYNYVKIQEKISDAKKDKKTFCTALQSFPRSTSQLAKSGFYWTANTIRQYLLKSALLLRNIDKDELSVYVAYTQNDKIEGVALTSSHNLLYIATHPKNIADNDRKVKGVGTALIKQIVADIGDKDLTATSAACAIGFYKKLGFEGSRMRMVLKNQQTKEFLMKYNDVGVSAQKEPLFVAEHASTAIAPGVFAVECFLAGCVIAASRACLSLCRLI